MEHQHQQQQQPAPPPQQPEPQLLPQHLEESMGTLAGQECLVVAKVMRFLTTLALSPNHDPFRRERAEAALQCAQVAARAAEEAKNKSPTPTSLLVSNLTQGHLQTVEEIMRNHFS